MKRRRKKKGNGSFNVWRSYSDMMCGLLLLFVLIMCVTLFQAQKTYDDSIKAVSYTHLTLPTIA